MRFHTSFVGRRKLLADVRERLTSSRLVTLTGPGGVGKTRVTLRIADEARRTYKDGCWIVGLAEINRPELLGPAVAEAVGLNDFSQPFQIQALSGFLAHRNALLVLDNCEHLLPAVTTLVRQLRDHCPNLKFLLASRRLLRIAGEVVIVVAPLSVPDEDGTTVAAEALAHYEAVNLFVERARSARSDFELTPDNAEDVALLCRDLEGIPLGIELAATRIRALTPREMRQGLRRTFQLLSLGYEDGPDRHRSLRACVEWSYELCSEAEKQMWRRAAVFSGGCELDAVTAVCAGQDLPAGEVLDLMGALVDQSVVTTEIAEPGLTRYRMLPGIRYFGREQAEEAGELGDLRHKHAAWCEELALDFDRGGSDQRRILRRLAREGANIRVAIEHLLHNSEEAERGMRMVTSLRLYWTSTGRIDEGRHWSRESLASDVESAQARALSLAGAARLAMSQNDVTAARQLLDSAARIRGLEDSVARGALLLPAAVLSAWEGDTQAALETSEAAVSLVESGGDYSLELAALFVAGVCSGMTGNTEAAVRWHRRCVDRAAQRDEYLTRSFAINGLGEQALRTGDHETASRYFREALAIKRDFGDRMGMAQGLDSLGRAAVTEEQGERAAILLGAAAELWESVGMAGIGNVYAYPPTQSDGIRRARKLLGKEQFRDLFRRGGNLALDAAIAFAMDDKLDAVRPPVPLEPSPLTKREMEVAELVADGLSNPQIAARLVISVRTAQGHVENILRKLGFNTRSLIASWVTERRMAEEADAIAQHEAEHADAVQWAAK